MRTLLGLMAGLLVLVMAVPGLANHGIKADLSRLVVVGDSLSAGFQNLSLLDRQQVHGFASLLAAQAGVPLALPLIGEPGIPNVLTLVDPGPPPVIQPAPGLSPGRVNPGVQPMNLAVPGAKVQDALTTRPDFDFSTEVLTDMVLGFPGLFSGISRSQVEWAEVLAPTTILLWIGNNDALGAAVSADASLLTPLAAFEASYTQLIDRLAATGATLVVANIPDVTVIALLTSAEDVALRLGLPLEVIGPPLGIGPGDLVTPDAFPLIEPILLGIIPGPLPPGVVLDAGEVRAIRAAIQAYNAVIAAAAAARGAVLVDVFALTGRIAARGIVVGGQRLTLTFLGGLLSLDGIHPTNTGYGVLANEFIKTMNRHLATGVPPVSLRQIQRDDPLVFPGTGHPPGAVKHLSPEAVEGARALTRP